MASTWVTYIIVYSSPLIVAAAIWQYIRSWRAKRNQIPHFRHSVPANWQELMTAKDQRIALLEQQVNILQYNHERRGGIGPGPLTQLPHDQLLAQQREAMAQPNPATREYLIRRLREQMDGMHYSHSAVQQIVGITAQVQLPESRRTITYSGSEPEKVEKEPEPAPKEDTFNLLDDH